MTKFSLWFNTRVLMNSRHSLRIRHVLETASYSVRHQRYFTVLRSICIQTSIPSNSTWLQVDITDRRLHTIANSIKIHSLAQSLRSKLLWQLASMFDRNRNCRGSLGFTKTLMFRPAQECHILAGQNITAVWTVQTSRDIFDFQTIKFFGYAPNVTFFALQNVTFLRRPKRHNFCCLAKRQIWWVDHPNMYRFWVPKRLIFGCIIFGCIVFGVFSPRAVGARLEKRPRGLPMRPVKYYCVTLWTRSFLNIGFFVLCWEVIWVGKTISNWKIDWWRDYRAELLRNEQKWTWQNIRKPLSNLFFLKWLQ